MGKLSISIPDELQAKVEAFAKETGDKVSGAIAKLLEEHFSRDSGNGTPAGSAPGDSSASKPALPAPSAPAPPSAPPSTQAPATDTQLADRVQALEASNQAAATTLATQQKRIGELDLRQSKLWHDVHDNSTPAR